MEKDSSLYVSEEGLKKIEKDLEYLISVRRAEVAEKIKEAKAFGDLSENSEYDEAKNEQAELEANIAKLENQLKNAQLIKEDTFAKGTVAIGSVVKIQDLETKEEFKYTIVGTTEADPLEDKISNLSPLGSALLHKKVNTKIMVETPDGNVEYKIIKISKK